MTIGTDESGIGYSFDDGIFEPVSVVLGSNAYIKQADQMIVVSREAMRAIAQTIIDESAHTAHQGGVMTDKLGAIAYGTVATREPSRVSPSRPVGRVSTIARGGR